MRNDQLTVRQRSTTADVEWRLGRQVTHVDVDTHHLTCDDGTSMRWKGLVFAPGVRSRRLHHDFSTRRHTIRTLDDAMKLAPLLADGVRVVVIGAGFIGCEVAATANQKGCQVTVVDTLAVPLVRSLGTLVGREVRRRHEQRGVTFELECTVARFVDGELLQQVLLDNGKVLLADVIVEAVGSNANTEPLEGQGLDLSDGVLCDEFLHPLRDDSPLLDMVAVGDVARFPLPPYSEVPIRFEHWSMPSDVSSHAAESLLAGLEGKTPSARMSVVPTFWTDQFDIRIQSLGLPQLGLEDVRVLEGDIAGDVAVGFHRDQGLVGVVAIGMTRRLGEYRAALMKSLGVDLGAAAT